jgi:putative transposase
MARRAPRSAPLGDGVVVFPPMARRGPLGGDQHRAAGAGPGAGGTRTDPQCRHSGQPVGQDHGKRGPRGYDGGKKIDGRKRHILVETEGRLLKARVHPANETDAEGAKALLAGLEQVFLRLALIWIDGGYKRRFVEWVEAELGWRVEVVQHPFAGVRYVWVAPGQEPPTLPSGFRVLKRRWVVERTFAWLGRNRRLSKDYEALPTSEEAWIYAASCRLLLRRLAA